MNGCKNKIRKRPRLKLCFKTFPDGRRMLWALKSVELRSRVVSEDPDHVADARKFRVTVSNAQMCRGWIQIGNSPLTQGFGLQEVLSAPENLDMFDRVVE